MPSRRVAPFLTLLSTGIVELVHLVTVKGEQPVEEVISFQMPHPASDPQYTPEATFVPGAAYLIGYTLAVRSCSFPWLCSLIPCMPS